jgi:hypothetical protein
MIEFPLYNKLKENLITEYDPKSICSKINCLDDENIEIVQALILTYFITHNGHIDVNKFKLPYNGKTVAGGKGCYYTFNNLPFYLQHIIATYVD